MEEAEKESSGLHSRGDHRIRIVNGNELVVPQYFEQLTGFDG